MRYGSCTYREIADLAANGAIAVVPLGCTEQQGPHLPVDFDSWFAETLILESAEQVEVSDDMRVLVLPVIPLGPTPEHRGFGAGYLDLPVDQHEAVARAAVGSLVAQGFRDVVVWRGCGQHELRGTVETLNATHAPARVHLPDPPFHAIWCDVADPTVPGGHADSFTTSIMLARRPELVRQALIPEPSRSPDWSDPNLDFTAYSDSGVIGDPGHASAAIGERLWQACTDWVAGYLRENVAPGGRHAEGTRPAESQQQP